MNDIELTQILKKHLANGIVCGSELLLTPNDAIAFIDDLNRIGVQIAGIEIWRYKSKDRLPDQLLEIPGAGGLLGKFMDVSTDNAEVSDLIKKFILEQLMDLIPEAEFVSLVFFDKKIYQFFRKQQARY